MPYEIELRFLRDVFQKSRVPLQQIGLAALMAGGQNELPPLREPPKPHTLYRLRRSDGRCYLYLLLPGAREARVLTVGPYLEAPMQEELLAAEGARLGLAQKALQRLREYYEAIPVLPEGDRLFLLLDSFCERIWQSPAFGVQDVSEEEGVPSEPRLADAHGELGDRLVSMRAMEQRYAFERELMQAVTLGQLHKEKLLVTAISGNHFEMRVADPLRNTKNYCIIMNTLLRKAAEEGGVHPMHLDSTSSGFAVRIEQLRVPAAGVPLMREMFRGYCRLVQKSKGQSLSRIVRQAVLLIDEDLSAELTLSHLAATLGVSGGYLSAVFRREMGETLSHYIRKRRMQYAADLLRTTELQVQGVALQCGILDVQYFSKLFKAEFGSAPTEYRSAHATGRGTEDN